MKILRASTLNAAFITVFVLSFLWKKQCLVWMAPVAVVGRVLAALA
jgi:hypothetical protein